MRKLKILVVHEVSYAKKVTYEYQEFPERLAVRGHDVSVIDYDDSGDGKYFQISYSKTGFANVKYETTPFINLPILKYITGRINYKKLLEKKLKNHEIDIVFLYSVFINGTNTVKLCKKYNIPVVYRIIDAYHLIRKNILIKYPLKFGERYIYKNVDVLCPTNNKIFNYAINLGRKPEANNFILTHGVDLSQFFPTEKDKDLLAKHNINQNDKIALFLGTTYSFAQLDLIIKNTLLIKKLIPDFKLLIVGAGDVFDELLKLVSELKLENDVICTGFVPFSEVPKYINLSDITFNSFQINGITKDIVPIKTLQYLACGKPHLSCQIPDVVKLFPEMESGVTYSDAENIDGFCNRIIDILKDESLLKKLSINACNFIKNNFDIEKQMDKLENLLLENTMKQ